MFNDFTATIVSVIKGGEDRLIEEWKQIDGFYNYEVSSFGNVRLKDTYRKTVTGTRLYKGKIIATSEQKNGYLTVNMKNDSSVWKTVSVHRLVAKTFIPNPENKREVNHVDGDKTNNNVSNLEWATAGENQRHARKLGLNRTELNPLCRKVKCIQTGQEFESIEDCARHYKVHTETIRNRLKRKVNKRILKDLDFEYIQKEPADDCKALSFF